MSIVASDTQFMRGINAAAILRELRWAEATPVAAIARSLGLSRQAVTRSLQSLNAAGFVSFSSPAPRASRQGRPAQLVEFKADAGHVLAISLVPSGVRMVLADLAGDLLADRRADPALGARFVSVVADQALSLLAESGLDSNDLWAATVSVPGIIDPGTGRVRLSSSMPFTQGVDIAGELTARLGCPTSVANEVKLATVGERWRGVSRDLSSMVLIEWGQRIGAGLVLNGSLYRGDSNDSGDIGFLDLHFRGTDRQTDPSLGPFEQSVGAGEIIRQVIARTPSGGAAELEAADSQAALDAVIDAFLADDAAAVDAIVEVAGRFAQGVAAIRALLDPEVVVIGGQMARCGPRLLELLNDALAGQVLNQPRLALSTLGCDAVMHGAVHHCLMLIDSTRFSAESLTALPPSSDKAATIEREVAR